MAQFQMKTSNRPQTIATVKSEVDIKSFRENPEWYEIIQEEKDTSEVKSVPVKVKRSKTQVKDIV